MKKNVLVFGTIGGLLLAAFMVVSIALCYKSGNFEGSMVLGYASMLLAFSLIFVAVKNYRDKFNQGAVSFGKAFRIGLYISLVASSFYVIAWLIDYYVFIPDFMDRYINHEIQKARNSGLTAAELQEQTKDLMQMKEGYKNPVIVILFTYLEVLPVGLVVSLIAALILKKKPAAKFSV